MFGEEAGRRVRVIFSDTPKIVRVESAGDGGEERGNRIAIKQVAGREEKGLEA